MKKKIMQGAAFLAVLGLAIGLGRFDLGLDVFPVFGLERRLGLSLIFYPLLGLVYGPLIGSVGALLVALSSLALWPATAFVGPLTFLIGPVAALVTGFIKKRNWFFALVLGLGVIAFWLYASRGLGAGALTLLFTVSIVGYTLISGVYAIDFTLSHNYMIQMVGLFFILLAGLHTAFLLAAALATAFYELPAYMWQQINHYTFLSYTYIYGLFSLLPTSLFLIVFPLWHLELGPVYHVKEASLWSKAKRGS